MHITPADNLKYRLYIQEVINRPRAMDQQPATVSNGSIWCEDWEIIEIIKYLFNGREIYYLDPPPNRLKNNPLWSRQDIECKAEALKKEFNGDADVIILALKMRRTKEYVPA